MFIDIYSIYFYIAMYLYIIKLLWNAMEKNKLEKGDMDYELVKESEG